MYNRLVDKPLVDKLSHKEAITKIYNDHQHLPGFSQRNILRNLPLDNPNVPRRIRPPCPKNSNTKSDTPTKLSGTIQEENQNNKDRKSFNCSYAFRSPTERSDSYLSEETAR